MTDSKYEVYSVLKALVMVVDKLAERHKVMNWTHVYEFLRMSDARNVFARFEAEEGL